jgi:hypothetical protein
MTAPAFALVFGLLCHARTMPIFRSSPSGKFEQIWRLPFRQNRFRICPGSALCCSAMESHARQVVLVPAPDRRQSETALAIARGTARLLRSLGFSCISELPLPSGRRADLVALNERGEIWIVEIKSSIEDLRADQKWPDYRAHCDRLFFAFTQDLPCEIFPRNRPDRRRRLWRASALRGAGASAAGADPQADDAAFCDGRGPAHQPPGRSARPWGVLGRKGTAAPGRRPQEAGQTGSTAVGPAQSQVATQLHRSGKPHHEVEGWLRSGL